MNYSRVRRIPSRFHDVTGPGDTQAVWTTAPHLTRFPRIPGDVRRFGAIPAEVKRIPRNPGETRGGG
jgi:hypothetical protein